MPWPGGLVGSSDPTGPSCRGLPAVHAPSDVSAVRRIPSLAEDNDSDDSDYDDDDDDDDDDDNDDLFNDGVICLFVVSFIKRQEMRALGRGWHLRQETEGCGERGGREGVDNLPRQKDRVSKKIG